MIKCFKNKENYFKLLGIALSLIVVLAFLYNSFTRYLNIDEREHLYSSYMIYNGYEPYRDFFQHHHPLLWYLFAPFLTWFKNSPEIWYVLRGFGAIINFGILYFIYKIAFFVGLSKKEALFSSLLYILFEAVWRGGIEFRPDNLALLCFIAGIYYFFCYVRDNNFKRLVVSYILFLLSFMAMQKIVLSLFVMGNIILFLPRDNKNISLEIWCLIVPLYGILGYVAYLYHIETLKDYFELNWILNLELSIVGRLYNKFIWVVPILGGIACLWLIKKANYFGKAIIILFWSQVVSVLWYAPFIHYLLLIYPFMCILLVYGIKKLLNERAKIVFAMILVMGGIRCGYWIYSYSEVPLSSYVDLSNVILTNTNENDEIIPGDIWSGGLRKNALGYYWFGWSIALLDYKLFHRHEFPDINKIIKDKKPKIVANKDAVMLGCLNDKKEQVLSNCKPLQYIDERAMADDYLASQFIYLRKY